MNLIDFTASPLSILPALLALSLAIISRRVLLSLSIGILSGALLLNDFSIIETTQYLLTQIKNLFIDGDSINMWTMSIVIFLIFLGMITALMTLSGGSAAFATWARTRIKTKRGSKLLVAFLGIFIFFDDYFNSLAVGAISRPITDKYGVSRPKLAYLLDSTAAPMCVLMPMSSWGAYIITIIGGILATHSITAYTPLGAFAAMMPMNFYAIFALMLVFVVACCQFDIGSMQRFETQAVQDSLADDSDARHIDAEIDIEPSDKGKVSHLVLPIVVLIVATIFWMVYSGANALAAEQKPFSILGAFENTDVGMSLLSGSTLSLIVAIATVFSQKIAASNIAKTIWIGAKSMFGAVLILFFAWTIGAVIKDMKTGAYLSGLLSGNLMIELLPLLLFFISAIMAFSTGTSWGTFGIMLPIAGDFSAAADINMILPALAAVLAGSVFGDHCSPISDTSILSSTGARCNHIDHVTTQLPYAIIGAVLAAVSFLVLGFTGSTMLALTAGIAVFIVIFFVYRFFSTRHLAVA